MLDYLFNKMLGLVGKCTNSYSHLDVRATTQGYINVC